jgi:hypothetical protein
MKNYSSPEPHFCRPIRRSPWSRPGRRAVLALATYRLAIAHSQIDEKRGEAALAAGARVLRI